MEKELFRVQIEMDQANDELALVAKKVETIKRQKERAIERSTTDTGKMAVSQ